MPPSTFRRFGRRLHAHANRNALRCAAIVPEGAAGRLRGGDNRGLSRGHEYDSTLLPRARSALQELHRPGVGVAPNALRVLHRPGWSLSSPSGSPRPRS